MPVIRKSLLELIFSGAYLLRWNDKLRPVELLEIDKQAHKMLLACVLWHEYTREADTARRVALATEIVEGGLFDYFYRAIITDIKPPIFYKIKANPRQFRALTQHVLERLAPALAPLGPFWKRMRAWHLHPDEESPARRILTAAHLYASQWEFRLIEPFNTPFDEEMDDIGQSFHDRLAAFADLPGLIAMRTPRTALARLANLCGQLRFQIRWTQAPRIPSTSVLGHMFIVACLAYFFSLTVKACPARADNNFFCGLFHDLPEVLTRDIISPVKQSIASLPKMIKEYEETELERRLFAPLREEGFTDLVARISYFLGLEVGSEFQECVRRQGRVRTLDGFDALQREGNTDDLDPKDGRLLKDCDNLAAFLEAHSSIRNGVSSPHLLEARVRLLTRLRESPLACLNLDALLADFD
ncbi:HD domain-containing protein [Desulfovibrio legallii]|uniref:HD domain-containing protein n=1 Tax=Desulfovibrio legallii TaxID=571438 RepID=A0A6H3F925_9BACT|nr:HD domain-containing protein [Desulfovibrio legallii]TBH78765.1 HD domain-containing protein [Desulfovibrio legallii]